LNEAQEVKYLEALNHKRKVMFLYKGLEVELQATPLAEELVLKLASWVTDQAVGAKALPDMRFEVGLFQDRDAKTKLEVEEDILAEHAAARATLARVLKTAPVDGTVVVDMLKGKFQMLRGIDKNFVLELMAWTAMHEEEPGPKAAQFKVKTALPTKTDLKTLQQSVRITQVIVNGSVYKFGDAALQSQVDSVKEVLAAMAAGSPLAVDHMKGSDFMIEVRP
jgi:hypothetical protein